MRTLIELTLQRIWLTSQPEERGALQVGGAVAHSSGCRGCGERASAGRHEHHDTRARTACAGQPCGIPAQCAKDGPLQVCKGSQAPQTDHCVVNSESCLCLRCRSLVS